MDCIFFLLPCLLNNFRDTFFFDDRTHPAISDVAVVGRPDERSQEIPRAYVVVQQPENGKSITDTDIKEWVRERVAPHKRLEGGVEFVEEIPKSASGKILRRVLRDRLLEELKQGQHQA